MSEDVIKARSQMSNAGMVKRPEPDRTLMQSQRGQLYIACQSWN